MAAISISYDFVAEYSAQGIVTADADLQALPPDTNVRLTGKAS
jgi:hypothetical protein